MDVHFNLYVFALLQWAVPSEQTLLLSRKKNDLCFRRIFNVQVKNCMNECLARSLCQSINYHRASKTCELNNVTNGYSVLRKARGWIYQEKSSFKNSKFSHCSCPGGEKCVIAPEGSHCVFEECKSLTGQRRSNMNTVGARSEHKMVCVRDIAEFDAIRDSKSNLFPLVCTPEGIWAIETESSCFTIAFALNSNTNIDPYKAWLTGDNSRSDIECLTSFNCHHHYRNDVIEVWNHLPISKIRFSIFKHNQEVHYIVFDGNNSMYTDWFSHIRVIESSWLDLVTTTTEIKTVKYHSGYFFSMKGHELDGRMRRFYINNYYNHCPGDQGWFTALFVTRYGGGTCDWEKHGKNSTFFMYSVQDTADVFGNAKLAERVYVLLDLKIKLSRRKGIGGKDTIGK